MIKQKQDIADDLRKLMGMQVRVDIAKPLRNHPKLSEQETAKAYQSLATEEVVDQMLCDLAREEVQASVAGGRKPTAAMLKLAGFAINQAQLS